MTDSEETTGTGSSRTLTLLKWATSTSATQGDGAPILHVTVTGEDSSFSSLTFAHRRLVASTDLHAGDTVIRIPSHRLLSQHSTFHYSPRDAPLIPDAHLLLKAWAERACDPSNDEALTEGVEDMVEGAGLEKEKGSDMESIRRSEDAGTGDDAEEKARELEHVTLMLFLAHAKHGSPHAAFSPYTDALPSQGLTTPLWLLNIDDDDETDPDAPTASDILARLDPTPLMDAVRSHQLRLQQILARLLVVANAPTPHFASLLPTHVPTLWRLLLWAHTMIESRAFRLTLPQAPDTLSTVMLPVLDLANHVADSAAANLEAAGIDASAMLVARATTSVRAGDPLRLCYREGLPNAALLLSYGFALPSNPNDRLDVALADDDDEDDEDDDDPDAAMLRFRKDLLLGGAAPPSDPCHALGRGPFSLGDPAHPGGVPPGLLASLRVLRASGDALEGVTLQNVVERAGAGLGRETEVAALEALAGVLEGARMAAEAGGSSLEEDERELERWETGEEREGSVRKKEAMLHALRYLVGQKRIVKVAETWCRARLEATRLFLK
ncbi:hypothetical protein HDU96_009021 [Phlyctochytrium bullatum]|nr:hypothetical protein HDU96_009021 [Phlyctochytrium bullatum]